MSVRGLTGVSAFAVVVSLLVLPLMAANPGVSLIGVGLIPGRPTQIYAFAIDGSAAGANVGVQPPANAGPLYPPGQVKKLQR